MSVAIQTLVDYCHHYLSADQYKDYCPNGLQVSGRDTVKSLAVAVTADLATIETACAAGVDLLLVHHGLFWQGQSQVVTGLLRKRLAQCLQHDLAILAYHLPLDAHPTLGNNAHLADLFAIEAVQPLGFSAANLGGIGTLPKPMTTNQFAQFAREKLGREPTHFPGGPAEIQRVAWCSGAAQDGLLIAAAKGACAYLSGEVSLRTVDEAKESGIHYFAAGHHATERGGVQRLGQHLQEKFDVSYQFIDSDNPV